VKALSLRKVSPFTDSHCWDGDRSAPLRAVNDFCTPWSLLNPARRAPATAAPAKNSCRSIPRAASLRATPVKEGALLTSTNWPIYIRIQQEW
jgi:hypothetical protein